MADDPIQNTALRRTVAAARAGADATTRIAPAPPPDQVESPWAGYREPRPQTHADERRQAAVDGVMSVAKEPRQPKTPRNSKAGKSADDGFELVDTFLDEWTKNVAKHNIGYANGRLARRLMRSGALLIKQQYEIDKLASLIRLGNELVKNTIDEGDEDKRIEEIRKRALSREDMSSTVPENANAGEEEAPEGEAEDAD